VSVARAAESGIRRRRGATARNSLNLPAATATRRCEEAGSGLDKVPQAELFQLPAPLFMASDDAFQAILYGPRKFAQMTSDERVRACYQHAVLKFLSGGGRMTNTLLCERFGIAKQNAGQATQVINKALSATAD
jgi:ATP-dependent DNA helicase RecG